MPKPSQRTRSKKSRRLRLPGGWSVSHFRRETVGSSSCSRCSGVLSGIGRMRPSRIRKLPTSQRTPEHMYGGQLCPGCLKDLLKHMVRGD